LPLFTSGVPDELNHTWSMDFVTDVLENKRRFRTFTVIDDYKREALHIEIDFSFTSNRIVWVLNHLVNKKGKPKKIQMDNGLNLLPILPMTGVRCTR
jgi:putative transposase